MDPFVITQVLHAIVHDPLRVSQLKSDDSTAFAGLDVAPELAQAILERDFPSIYRWGAHPIALFHLSAVLQPRAYYVREVVPRLQGASNYFDDYYRARDVTAEVDRA